MQNRYYRSIVLTVLKFRNFIFARTLFSIYWQTRCYFWKKKLKNQLVHQFSVVKEINRLPSLNSFPQLFSRKIKKKKKETLLFLSFILRIGNKNLSICHEYSIKRKLACQRGWERERERVGTKSRSRDSGSPWRGASVKFLFPSSRSADGRRLSQRASNPVSLVFFSLLLALFLNAPGYIVPRCDDPSRALTAIEMMLVLPPPFPQPCFLLL